MATPFIELPHTDVKICNNCKFKNKSIDNQRITSCGLDVQHCCKSCEGQIKNEVRYDNYGLGEKSKNQTLSPKETKILNESYSLRNSPKLNSSSAHSTYLMEVEALRGKLRELRGSPNGRRLPLTPADYDCLKNPPFSTSLPCTPEPKRVRQTSDSENCSMNSVTAPNKRSRGLSPVVKEEIRRPQTSYSPRKVMINPPESRESNKSSFSIDDKTRNVLISPYNSETPELKDIKTRLISKVTTLPPTPTPISKPKPLQEFGDCSSPSRVGDFLEKIKLDDTTEEIDESCFIRPSLFSNVPPYVRFISHDAKGPQPMPKVVQKVLKWKLSTITPLVIRNTVVNSGFKLVKRTNDWTGCWGRHMKSICFKILQDNQKMNHIPGTFQIGRKDRLWKNLYKLMLKYGKKEFGFIPRTFILPQDTKALRAAWDKVGSKPKWIVKPPAAARGTGIKVISKWTQVPKKSPVIVQRYISNPYLINGNKFDLRLYVLIPTFDPLRVYLYDNGLVRFASAKYSDESSSLSNRYIHLTNYSINKLSNHYSANEDAEACEGHKWTIKSLWTYLEGKVNVEELWKNLVDLVIKTMISGESPISQLSKANLNSRYCSYELFGVDVLLDEEFKPWLLEVNISPSLHSSSPLDLAVKGPMVKDLLNMAGYHIPNRLSELQEQELLKKFNLNGNLVYDSRMYVNGLSPAEKNKQLFFNKVEERDEYLIPILADLTPDDIRHLIVYEDELTQLGNFQKIFPTPETYSYHQFFEGHLYYNRLFDAWETKHGKNRSEGIQILNSKCLKELHLDINNVEMKQSTVYSSDTSFKGDSDPNSGGNSLECLKMYVRSRLRSTLSVKCFYRSSLKIKNRKNS